MGSTLSSRVLILGIDGSGKTTFLNKFQNPKQNISAEPTASFNEHDVKFGGLKVNVLHVLAYRVSSTFGTSLERRV